MLKEIYMTVISSCVFQDVAWINSWCICSIKHKLNIHGKIKPLISSFFFPKDIQGQMILQMLFEDKT